MKKLVLTIVIILLLIAIGLSTFAYIGSYIGEEKSPDQNYTLKYFKSFNPLKIYWSMPGGKACEPRWIRLYDQTNKKLNQLYTTSCELEMQVTWTNNQVFLPDGKTIWPLP